MAIPPRSAAERVYLRDIDLAQRYGISRSKVWADIAPNIPSVKFGAKTTRWHIADVEAFDAAKRAEAAK